MLPIHNHSEFSALDGYGTVDEIAARIEALGLSGAFLTDHGLVAGHRSFAKAMSAKGLYAGFGMEGYQAAVHRKDRPDAVSYIDKNGKKRSKRPRDAAHVILLAQSQRGLSNLYRLSDEANRTGFYHSPRMDWELLEKYNDGIICTSACMGGLVSKGVECEDHSALERYLQIFGDRFFIELHTYHSDKQRKLNNALWSIAQERGIPVVYANDAHYCGPEEYMQHEMILNIQMKSDFRTSKVKSVDGEVDDDYSHDGNENHYHPQCLYIMGEEEVRSSLSYLPQKVVDEAIANSDVIANLCQVRIEKPRMHMPTFQATEGISNEDYLLDLVYDGLEEKYQDHLTPDVLERADYEFQTLTSVDLGNGATLGDYFLINWDWITNFCGKNGITTGPGRGSVGGSILAYALGITHIDPLKYDLQFERFWNAGRASGFPDIDTDIEKARRDDVKQYLLDKYGTERVLSIGNHIRLRPKSAFERVAVAYFGREHVKKGGLYPIIDEIKGIIDSTVDAGQQPDWPEIWELVGHELEPYKNRSQDWTNVFEIAEKLTGRISTYGVHASAVVVSDVDLPENMPCRSAKPDDSGERVMVTQADMHEVEDEGFLKLDALGLRNLDTLSLTAKLAGENIDFWSIDYESLPEECWKMIEEGLTLGLFQIEEGKAAKHIGKSIKPRCIEDLAAIVALNRPGPLRSGMVDRFIDGRNGSNKGFYGPRILKDILEPTYGDFLYQEQVIAYFRAIGYSLSDADHIRKLLGKKLVEEMKEEYPKYIEYAIQHMDEEVAKGIWDEIIGFSKYSFNKSHAIGYGIILAATMYAKWKYPTEFIMASIQTTPAKVGKYILEGKRLGVKVKPPDINKSQPEIAICDNEIYFGLSDVKYVGKGAARQICRMREFAGGFDDYNMFMDVLQSDFEAWDSQEVKKGRSPKQLCTQRAIDSLVDAGAFDDLGMQEDPRERSKMQKELIGISLVDLHSKVIEGNPRLEDIPALSEVNGHLSTNLRAYGIVSGVKIRRTRANANPLFANKDYAMLEIEWNGCTLDAVMFNQQWERYKDVIIEDSLCLFELKFTDRGVQVVAGERL